MRGTRRGVILGAMALATAPRAAAAAPPLSDLLSAGRHALAARKGG